jgi:hypothetical protein
VATTGSYKIWPADGSGNLVDPPDFNSPAEKKFPNPSLPEAADIYFGIDATGPQPPPKDQGELQGEIERVLNAVQRLYLSDGTAPQPRFRRYYVRLFRLAQLGLEGPDASPEVAKGALATVKRDLIDDEAGRVKNGHLIRLGLAAAWFSVPFVLLYVLLALFSTTDSDNVLLGLGVQRATAANFMVLWVGCFLGVWLSYGIRTSTITIEDLTTTDSDRLLPHVRLLFAGALTMLAGMLFVLGIVEVKIGPFATSKISTDPALAFIVGIFCGISEAGLPGMASRRAAAFIADLK